LDLRSSESESILPGSSAVSIRPCESDVGLLVCLVTGIEVRLVNAQLDFTRMNHAPWHLVTLASMPMKHQKL
jgi:hypothetical protein